MFSKNSEFSYEVDPNFDFVIDEKGNKFISLRKIKWGSSDEYKLDLRNYVSNEDGERMLKGCTFISEETGHELANVLVREGYGHPDDIVNNIVENRRDIYLSMANHFNNIGQVELRKLADEYDSTAASYMSDLDEVI